MILVLLSYLTNWWGNWIFIHWGKWKKSK